MYLSEIEIEGFRCIKDKTNIKFNKGINILVGDNRSGKSTIIDSIRVLLQENEYSREGVKENDFYHSIDNNEISETIKIRGKFSSLEEEDKIKYLTWLDSNYDALLNIEINNKLDGRNNYKKRIYGGNSSNSIFEWDAFNNIQCVYLPALRDSERKLKNIKGSRLSHLLLNLSERERNECRKKNELTELEKKVESFNDELSKSKDIDKARGLINASMVESLGEGFSEKINIQFEEQSYTKIVESLKLMFYPEITDKTNIMYKDLIENSLGYNNLIYIATILAEFEGLKEELSQPRILLIEEIEAHLNPQIQIKLIKFLEKKSVENNIQIIITTHSPTIASSIGIDNIICFNYDTTIKITSLNECNLGDKEKKFLNRWLDVTKSTLLFSRGVLLVEGLAENLLIGKIAQIYLKDKEYKYKSLEDAGISIINMGGIFFQYFFKLFDGYSINELKKEVGETKKSFETRKKEFIEKSNFDENEYKKTAFIPINCVALTDFDSDSEGVSKNPQYYKMAQVENMTKNCRVFVNKETFEYDIALFSDNAKIMLEILNEYIETEGDNKNKINAYLDDLNQEDKENKEERAKFILKLIKEEWMGKGLFAQLLEEKIDNNFSIPQYIIDAIEFLIN